MTHITTPLTKDIPRRTIWDFFADVEGREVVLAITDHTLDQQSSAVKDFRDWGGMSDACWTVIRRNGTRPFVDRGTLGMLMGEVMTEYNREPGNRWPPVWLKIKKELSRGGPTTVDLEEKQRAADEKDMEETLEQWKLEEAQ